MIAAYNWRSVHFELTIAAQAADPASGGGIPARLAAAFARVGVTVGQGRGARSEREGISKRQGYSERRG